MKSCLQVLLFATLVCAFRVSSFALDREAFSFTNYDLQVRIEPEQHRLGARGKITLRNDTAVPQKIAILQISSSLDWRVIRAGDTALQFVTQPYTSDIDHTGGLSEAIVTLPQAVAPHSTVDLDIAYEGVIVRDATRLIRIGTPEDAATSSDWDQISTNFTGVRGAGYVAWYPIATEVANLSEGNSLFDVLARWKDRESRAKMRLHIDILGGEGEQPLVLVISDASCKVVYAQKANPSSAGADCVYDQLAGIAPVFVAADYKAVDRSSIVVYNLPTDATAAVAYADAAGQVMPLIADWFGSPREKARTVDLPDAGDAPFESGSLLLTPLADMTSARNGLAAAHQLTHAAYFSARPWIYEGLAHFAQALYLERERGRAAALQYMDLHRSALTKLEAAADRGGAEESASGSLVNTSDPEIVRSKGMCVWWMLRDIVGAAALKKALAAYRSEQDKEASYLPRLIAAQTQRDLEWFFDDWVYRDRGLPDFKVESAFSRKTMNNTFLLTITVDNLGTAGADVPVIVKFAGGESTKRLEVRAKSKAVIRVETPAVPQEIVVNDGSVPESDMTNNSFRVQAD